MAGKKCSKTLVPCFPTTLEAIVCLNHAGINPSRRANPPHLFVPQTLTGSSFAGFSQRRAGPWSKIESVPVKMEIKIYYIYIYIYRFQHAHSAFFHTVARLVSARAMVSLTIWPMWKGWPTASHKITQAHRAWRAFTRHISGQTSIGKPWHTPVGRDTA